MHIFKDICKIWTHVFVNANLGMKDMSQFLYKFDVAGCFCYLFYFCLIVFFSFVNNKWVLNYQCRLDVKYL